MKNKVPRSVSPNSVLGRLVGVLYNRGKVHSLVIEDTLGQITVGCFYLESTHATIEELRGDLAKDFTFVLVKEEARLA